MFVKKLAALAATVAITAVTLAAGATAASAGAGGPLPVVSANVNGYHGTVRPHHIYIGQGGAPLVRSLRWTHWSQYTAHAAGRLIQQIPGCTKPSYQCPVSSRYVSVKLSRPVAVGGREFFSRMRWAGHTDSGARRVIHFKLDGGGYWYCPVDHCTI